MFEKRQAADAWTEPCSSCLFSPLMYFLINGNLQSESRQCKYGRWIKERSKDCEVWKLRVLLYVA